MVPLMPSTEEERNLRIRKWILDVPDPSPMCTLDVRDGELRVQISNTWRASRPTGRALCRHLEPGKWAFESSQFENYNNVWWINLDDAGNMHLNGRIGLFGSWTPEVAEFGSLLTSIPAGSVGQAMLVYQNLDLQLYRLEEPAGRTMHYRLWKTEHRGLRVE